FWQLLFNNNLRRLKRFMLRTYGQLAPSFIELLVDRARNLIEINIQGIAIKSEADSDAHRRLTHNLIAASNYLEAIILTLIPAHRDVFIIFDQLDRAWDATQDTKDVLIGLLLAAKDLIRDATSYQKAVRVIVFLR